MTEIIDGTVNEEGEVETQPMSRIAKLKSLAKDPFAVVGTIGVIATVAVLVVAVRNGSYEETENENTEEN